MTDMPPKRLLDDPAISAELRSDLRAEQGRPAGYDAAAGLAAFSATLGAAGTAGKAAVAKAAAAKAASGTGTGLGAATATKLGMATVVKGVAALTVAAGLGAVGWQLGAAPRSQPAPTPARTTAAAHLEARPVPASTPAASDVETAEAPPTAKPIDLRTPEPAPSRAVTPAGPSDPLQAEIATLARIKRVLDRRPALALRLAERAQARFGEGMFYQEREGLAVLALDQLGRTREARQRGERLLARYPQSPLAARIRAALASSAPDDRK